MMQEKNLISYMSPRIIIHNAVSADGRYDYFTPDVGLYYELLPTWKEDATLVGSETILKSETVPTTEDETVFQKREISPEDERPILFIPDSKGRIWNWYDLIKSGYWKHFAALCSLSTPDDYLDYLKKRHIDVVICGKEQVDFRKAIPLIGEKYGVKTIRVDSGGTLNGILLRSGLVSEISLLFFPQLVGGTSPKSIYQAPDLTSSEEVIDLKLISLKKLRGGVVWGRWSIVNGGNW
jgi:2,5-diamino-6-(ribosylamino)-4(3H)-pyrimidinone 5'-phosphate reductase